MWYGNNRSFVHKNACRASGGIGFLVKRTLIDCHDVDVIENQADGIIALGISNKKSHFSTLIIGLYVPPENSVIGEKIDSFLENVTNMLYEHNDYDMTIVCGDFNSRLGKELDYIPEIDVLPLRVIIDEVHDQNGITMCDFLLENKLAVVNGRVCPLKDNFTCINTRGRSVIDYFVVAQENMENVTDFEVRRVTDIINMLSIHELVGGRMSDHSIVLCEVKMSYDTVTLGACDWLLSLRNSPVFHSAGAVDPMGKLSNCRQLLTESAQSHALNIQPSRFQHVHYRGIPHCCYFGIHYNTCIPRTLGLILT